LDYTEDQHEEEQHRGDRFNDGRAALIIQL
jgi:hypothetical protein